MKQVIVLVIAIMCFVLLCACQSDNQSNAIINLPDNLENVDLKCECSVNDGEHFIIESNEAKKLYEIASGGKTEETQFQAPNENSNQIYLVFKSDEKYCGCFWIRDDDYITYTVHPEMSRLLYYKSDGIYKSILEIVNKQSQSN